MEGTESSIEATWVSVIRQLYNHLQENDDKFNLLRNIDRGMVDISLNLEQFVSSSLSEFARLSHATEAHFYIDSGDELFLLHTTSSQKMPKSITLAGLSSILPNDQKNLKTVGKRNLGQMESFFSHASSLLMIPVWLPPDQAWPSAKKRFGVMILEEIQYVEELNPFKNQAIQSFARTAVGQLALGLRFRLNNRQSEWFQELIDAFFRLDLEPYECFKELAKKIPDYLPLFGPFQIKSKPGVLVLIHDGLGGNYLTIVGTTGEETGDKLKVEESVVGLLFENPEIPYIIGDPRHDPKLKSRYKAYSGKQNGMEIKTELAAPIEGPHGTRIAVVNLESEFSKAFTQIHIDALLYLCDLLSPIVTALQDRIIERLRRQDAVMYAQRSYWHTVGAVLRHDTRSQLASIRIGIDNAKMAAKINKTEKIEKILAPLYDNLKSVEQEVVKFSEQIYGYTVYGSYPIRIFISEAIDRIKDRLEESKWVRIDFSEGEDFDVFCSPILTMHLYNIIDNSLYWVNQRIARDPSHQGKVSIVVGLGPMPTEDQEQELNRTCEVIITDNGPGCPKENLAKLFNRPVTSLRTGEQGMGYALYAANNYLYGIGGSIKAESEEGEWFKVTITVPIFDPRIHRIRSSAEG